MTPSPRLGATDLDIAPLVLGGDVFSWTRDEQASLTKWEHYPFLLYVVP